MLNLDVCLAGFALGLFIAAFAGLLNIIIHALVRIMQG